MIDRNKCRKEWEYDLPTPTETPQTFMSDCTYFVNDITQYVPKNLFQSSHHLLSVSILFHLGGSEFMHAAVRLLTDLFTIILAILTGAYFIFSRRV